MDIDVKHWYSLEKIIDDLKEDQKKALTENETPTKIASRIQNIECAINNISGILYQWKEEYGYPNVSNLKYVHRY